jgi:cystathionine beta-lyase
MRNGFEDLELDELWRRRSEKWRKYPPGVLPAFVAEMDYDLAEPVLAALHSAVDRSDCGYATPDGVGETFARFADTRHGWAVDPERVHLIPDVMAGVDAILALATEPGDRVVINPPVYPPFFEHIGFARRQVVEVPLARTDGGWELDFAGLEAAFAAGARAYLLCSPHNPTGRVFSAADLERVASLAEQYGVLVVVDEIHASLTLPGARHTPFVSLGGAAAEHGVTLASASKAFNLAGLKGAVAVAGSASAQRLLGRLPSSSQYGAGLFGVLASVAAWEAGDEWLDALLGQLDRMRSEFGRLLGQRLPGARYLAPEASYLAWVDCSALGLGPEPASVFLERGRVALGRGLDFGAPGDGFARVTIGTSSAILAEIVDRMAAAVLGVSRRSCADGHPRARGFRQPCDSLTEPVLGADARPEFGRAAGHLPVPEHAVHRGGQGPPVQRADRQGLRGHAQAGQPPGPEALVNAERPDDLRPPGQHRGGGCARPAVVDDRMHPGEEPVVRRAPDHQEPARGQQPPQVRAQRSHDRAGAGLADGHYHRRGQALRFGGRHAAETQVDDRIAVAEEFRQAARR